MESIDTIIELSHEFGTPHYVLGGGGNSSCKDADALWVKPSGTTLIGLTAEQLVKLDRSRIAELYAYEPPDDARLRESQVKDIMEATVCEGFTGRPSVEAPLHDSFPYTYVVHTHPAWVNGLTCGVDGESECARLFPDAMWVPYVDPGYTLCAFVREQMQRYADEKGHFPKLVILENHGIFVAADTAEEIRDIYARVINALEEIYIKAGIVTALQDSGTAPSDDNRDTLAAVIASVTADAHGEFVEGSAPFDAMTGPLTPDHIVYAKSYPLIAEPVTAEAAKAFIDAQGYPPAVVVARNGVYGVGANAKDAGLALEFARDGALVQILTRAFGGTRYLSDAAREFIEQWEVEAYRKQVSVA